MTDTSRERVEDLATAHETSAGLYHSTIESGRKAMHATAAATLRALLDRAEKAEAECKVLRLEDAAVKLIAFTRGHERGAAGIAAAVAAERERNAQVAEIAVDECSASYCGQCYPDALTVRDCPDNGTRIAAAIRARGTP